MIIIKIFVCIHPFQSRADVYADIVDPTNPALLEIKYAFSTYTLLKSSPIPIIALNFYTYE